MTSKDYSPCSCLKLKKNISTIISFKNEFATRKFPQGGVIGYL